MGKFKKRFAGFFAVLITAALLLTVVPSAVIRSVAVGNEQLTFGVMSDLHYYPQSLMGSDIPAFIEASKLNASTSYLADALLDNALYEYEQQAKTRSIKYILIPGDLTKNGEYEGHRLLSQKLKDFEDRTGIQVLVINGNHDIRRTSDAAAFNNGKFETTRATEPEEFRELYADLGYDLADAFFTPPEGEEAGMLSYAATLEGGYRLIALDGGCYSADSTSNGENEGETRGAYSEGLIKWALQQIADAKAKGLTVIGLTHFNLVEHFDYEDNLFTAFPIENWQNVCESFADAGMHFAFTGHIHMPDIASHTSDNGETLTDCSSASLLSYPCYLRIVTFDNTSLSGKVTAQYETVDIDNSRPVTAFGTTYPKPYKNTAFALNFGGSDINAFVTNILRYQLEYNLLPQIEDAGSLYMFLSRSLDLDSVLDSLLSGNTGIGAIEGVTKISLKLLIKNVCDQLERAYLDGADGTEHLLKVADTAIRKVTSMPVSDLPCTKFISTFGFGDASKKGTFADAASSCLAYIYTGNEDRSDDAFMNDVIARFERGEIAEDLLNTLIDVILHDILEDEILQNIHIDLVGILRNTNDEDTKLLLGEILTQIIAAGDENNLTSLVPQPSLMQLINIFFAAGIVEYKSLDDVLNYYMDAYLTDSQIETIAYEFYNVLTDFTTDTNPGTRMDNNTIITYNGKVAVTPTVEDLRLPSGISVTFGSNAATTRNFSWFTKTSVTGTDIEIVPYSENPKFTGKPTTGSNIVSKTAQVTKEIPGVDLGVIGVISYSFDVNRHMIRVSGLTPGKKYCYRVGDASRGWWSEVGVMEMADNSDAFTFFHMSDSQAGIERQYENWAQVVDTAFDLYPQAKFIVHTGDVVDSGKNFKQWNWVFNTASSNLLKTALMPATGNHETNMDYATVENFLLEYPEQDTTQGVYYSYDYNNAHFMVLNTNDLNADNTLSAQQLAWLEADAAASDKPWKIVAMHKAVYSNGSHYADDDVTALRKQLSVLMPQLDIDVVLQGHDHVYLRTAPMNANAECTVTERTIQHNGSSYNAMVNPDGTVYAIDGCAGVKYYQTKDAALTDQLFPRAEKIVDATAPVFSAISIDGDNLYFDAYTVENGKATKIDSFAITKADAALDDAQQGGDQTADTSDIPKTAGRQAASAFVFLIPMAVTIGFCTGAIKRKREQDV